MLGQGQRNIDLDYFESIIFKIWTCPTIGKGQPRVIIWKKNYDGIESPMLQYIPSFVEIGPLVPG